MSTAKSKKSSQEPTKSSRFKFVKAETKVSRYDLVSALLVSLLIIVGFFATILGLIWITSTFNFCLLYTSPSPRDGLLSRMPSSA